MLVLVKEMPPINRNNKTDHSYKQLKVWELSHQLVLDIYKVTKKFPASEKYGLTSQLRRSISSVPTNIVEGNSKKTSKEYIQFLYTAKASLAEATYQLLLARDLKYLSGSSYSKLNMQATEIGKMLSSLVKYLKSKK